MQADILWLRCPKFEHGTSAKTAFLLSAHFNRYVFLSELMVFHIYCNYMLNNILLLAKKKIHI